MGYLSLGGQFEGFLLWVATLGNFTGEDFSILAEG